MRWSRGGQFGGFGGAERRLIEAKLDRREEEEEEEEKACCSGESNSRWAIGGCGCDGGGRPSENDGGRREESGGEGFPIARVKHKFANCEG